MKIKVDFKYNGRSVRPEDFTRTIMKDITQQVMREASTTIRKKIQTLHCPVHGARPTLRPKPTSKPDDVAFDVIGCCQDLIDSVQAKIRSTMRHT